MNAYTGGYHIASAKEGNIHSKKPKHCLQNSATVAPRHSPAPWPDQSGPRAKPSAVVAAAVVVLAAPYTVSLG
ncbi:unnamed protein product [Gadus morhua 'NCC']